MTNAPGLPGEGFMKSMDRFFDLPETAINMSINLSQYIPINLRKSCTPKAGAVFSSVGHNHVGILIAWDGTNITIQEGNIDGKPNTFQEAKKIGKLKLIPLVNLTASIKCSICQS